ncbi:uncharacterized protein LOC135710370 [Ochlerotatus camptorhynchus]|uniref:uncharacterized protein LOC135710370 n=1 Tax=Ochlerotatus camptorhynchus TaxID=644619 RepID=UPI0031D703FC
MWLAIGSILSMISLLKGQYVLAPYQVSIRSSVPTIVGNLASNGFSKQICNGIIIRDKYILTTANCMHVQDMQTRVSRTINPSEIFIIAGNINLNQADYGEEAKGTFRRNVVSVISHGKFNASTGENDIALLKLDRSMPLYNNTNSVRWIELQQQQHQQSHPQSLPGSAHHQQQTTAAATNNKVNENCFINIYNNSVGVSDYPYTLVRNVSFFQKWVCDAQRGSIAVGQTAVGRNGTCIEYRFSNPQSCWLDANSLRRSEERGTALICNFKLVAILAEINPPSNPQSCTSIKRSTAYYTMIEPYHDWIVSEIGYLYTAPSPAGVNGTVATSGPMATQPNPNGSPAAPIPSWGDQEKNAITPGKSKSTAAPSISSGIVFKLILFNLFIPFAFVYRFHH